MSEDDEDGVLVDLGPSVQGVCPTCLGAVRVHTDGRAFPGEVCPSCRERLPSTQDLR